MRLVVLIGLVIVFISTMFVLTIFNSVIKDHISCVGDTENPRNVKCEFETSSVDFLFGLAFMIFFVALDIGTVFLMFTGL